MTGVETAAAIAAASAAAAPAAAGAAGAAGAGAGAGLLGAGAMGAAGLGATGTALGAEAGLLGASALGAEAAGAGAAGMGGGTAGLFGAAEASPLAAEMMASGSMAPSFTEGAAMASQGQPMGMDIAMGAKDWTAAAPEQSMNFGKMAKFAQKGANMMQQQPQQQSAPGQRPASGQAQQAQEIVEQLKRKRGNRSNWAGLLSAAIGSQR